MHIHSFNGRLKDHFILQDISIHTVQAEVSADRIEVDWKPLALFEGAFVFPQITINKLKIIFLEHSEEKNNFHFALPWYLQKISLAHLSLQESDFIFKEETWHLEHTISQLFIENHKISSQNLYWALQTQFSFFLDAKSKAKQHIGIDFQLDLKNINQSNFTFNFLLKKLFGESFGQKVSGKGIISGNLNEIFWKEFNINIGKSMLNIHGNFSKHSNLQWGIDIPNLTYWLPEMSGKIFSHGYLIGDFFKSNFQFKTFL